MAVRILSVLTLNLQGGQGLSRVDECAAGNRTCHAAWQQEGSCALGENPETGLAGCSLAGGVATTFHPGTGRQPPNSSGSRGQEPSTSCKAYVCPVPVFKKQFQSFTDTNTIWRVKRHP